jgi:tRNA (guanine37-N1)-methyltransferase
LRKRLRKAFTEANPSLDYAGVNSAFDIIGELAIIKIPKDSPVSAIEVAKIITGRHKNVKSVFVQTTEVQGDFRLRGLAHVMGENRTRTVHRESGCAFKVDVAKCYFSPRLSGERMRIASLVEPGEALVNMFAGVGCFSIIVAKHVNNVKVYSIDINPTAVELMAENVRLNGVYGNVVPILGDSKDVINDRLQRCADRVLMPLPEKSFEYLPAAFSALKPKGGWIHVYAFEHSSKAEKISERCKQKLSKALSRLNVDFDVRAIKTVRSTGPNWWQLVADIHVNG